ncbi:glycosyltransferase family 2 protein [Actinobacillus pleuropneumoniae]|uniref:Glycosyltransferase family 2 protein n=2 Tax=Actinobacillus pleuropneumoniae TaxID=715 RepID=A0ABN5ML00_ACTPL|nr:glycosyltransferase family A protein [Actinobacillus pleuropneumoniae]ASU14846.1 PGL/p-HBAD biosynthesis glycosyltransferase [Actinobacillus pleuropneumoniae]AWG95458.1 glycosyltransferase family 2 protein [Actinobacillus pleuropneumoniae serovar 1 str. 4074]AXA21529.1 glycosyltransferase family 2 protein [Actinobacillus pleuropneumoniae]MBL4535492.1 glycosyltransferase family 2 protein [Actinobacillus pleuropneumoniae]MCI1069689.1 glycosyltransferase family 2 protein [Actinobacillus pleuro
MFSIIVPSYNRNQEIPALLESLTKQTLQNFEVIVVDDFSQQPVTVTQAYPFTVKVIRNNPNKGAAGSRNVGAEHASYEWLLFLDDDDRFADQKCEVLAQEIAQHPQANFIYHPAECVMVNEGFSYVTKPLPSEKLNLDAILLANKIGGMPMLGIKKSFFFELGGLATDLKSLEDYEFVLKAVSSPNFAPLFVDQPLSICGFHTKRSSVSTNTTNTELALAAIRQKYVKTETQAANFAMNSLYILSYPYAMNLSRQAASYYLQMFKRSHSLKHLIIAMVTFISPKLAINMKRFI